MMQLMEQLNNEKKQQISEATRKFLQDFRNAIQDEKLFQHLHEYMTQYRSEKDHRQSQPIAGQTQITDEEIIQQTIQGIEKRNAIDWMKLYDPIGQKHYTSSMKASFEPIQQKDMESALLFSATYTRSIKQHIM